MIKSYTEVTFTMTYDVKEPKGYVFLYDATLYLDSNDHALIDACVNETHQRCPISKILNSQFIKIQGSPIKK
jgi:organic hydroperoxide reductase OsmC/OhrA